MVNPNELDEAYKDFSEDLRKWVPDGVIPVDLTLLNDIGLLTCDESQFASTDQLTHYFQVIENQEKVTLFNQQFAIWIAPKTVNELPSTFTYLALMHQDKPHLELVFSTSGVYNSPKYILRILQYFINEVLDNEATIDSIGKKP